MDAGAPFAPHAPEYQHASSVRADAHDLFVYLSRRRRAEAVPLTGAFKKSKSCEKRKAPHIAHCKGGHRKAIWEVHGRPFVLAEVFAVAFSQWQRSRVRSTGPRARRRAARRSCPALESV